MRIDRADSRILVAAGLVEEAFNHPSPQFYGQLEVLPEGLELSIICNGRNRQVKYRLSGLGGGTENAWEAELIADSMAELFVPALTE